MSPNPADSLLPKPDEEDLTEEHKLYSVFRNYASHEAALINYRLNWNITIQGFLFAAYTFTVQKASELKVALLLKLQSQVAPPTLNHAPGLADLHITMIAIAVVGTCVSIAVYASVFAARISQLELQTRWFELHPEYKSDPEGGKNHTHGPRLPGLLGGGHLDT
jgi:hypothetical protein